MRHPCPRFATRMAPDRVIAFCPLCERTFSQTRRQNAMARAAKLRAVVWAHLREAHPFEYLRKD